MFKEDDGTIRRIKASKILSDDPTCRSTKSGKMSSGFALQRCRRPAPTGLAAGHGHVPRPMSRRYTIVSWVAINRRMPFPPLHFASKVQEFH